MKRFLALVLLPACGFVQSAGDVEIGAGTIPSVKQDLKLPGPDEFLGNSLKSGTGAFPGAPTSLAQGTLAHVQGVMAITGECFKPVKVDTKPPTTTTGKAQTATLSNVQVTIINCGDPEHRCVSRCQGFRGMRLEARVEIELLNKDQAKKVKDTVPKSDGDAIRSIRARFSTLSFYEMHKDAAGKDVKVSINKQFANYQLGLASAGTPTDGGDDTVLVDGNYLARVSKATPQRFELDSNAPFTKKLKAAVLKGAPVSITVFQRLDVAEQNLYSVHLGNSGVELDFQPEFVIDAITVVKDNL